MTLDPGATEVDSLAAGVVTPALEGTEETLDQEVTPALEGMEVTPAQEATQALEAMEATLDQEAREAQGEASSYPLTSDTAQR